MWGNLSCQLLLLTLRRSLHFDCKNVSRYFTIRVKQRRLRTLFVSLFIVYMILEGVCALEMLAILQSSFAILLRHELHIFLAVLVESF